MHGHLTIGFKSIGNFITGRSIWRNPPIRASARSSPTRKTRPTTNSPIHPQQLPALVLRSGRKYSGSISQPAPEKGISRGGCFAQDHFLLDRQLPVRPVRDDPADTSQPVRSRERGFLLQHLPPPTHPYARNAIFAGLTPLAIDKIMPDLWLNDNEEGGKNQHEEEFLRRQIQSQGKRYDLFFDKIIKSDSGKR